MSDRSILITGCSSGIGYDAAVRLSKRGWRVFAACRDGKDVERMIAGGLEGVKLDYEDPDSIARAADAVLETTKGRLDALFNNGAYAIPGPIEDLSRAAMETQFQANFLGWHDLTVRLIPAMRAQGRGRIVNCSSVLGLITMPFRGSYCATKYAVEAWSDALRMELRSAGIRVSLIEPGPIDTKFRPNAIKQFEKWVDWENSARADEYRESLLERLHDGSGESRFELPASAVTLKLIHAVENRNPKPRYYVTTPTYGADVLRRILPTTLLDRIFERG